ncbi:universal stress protein [Ginsengibacter hankyongi]|uniref:Universal stress protein n=1 Tax=Ginsengibacter hankyongi TaxID=2607284 RepID=A0A5J5IEC0_9BACT|nr:universal stress protein [Ginsengibacter hankyongi]KAA9037198.1 universal stress protein [Ginsengibacter hankyongi]
MKTIIVATNYSIESNNAMKYAAEIAKSTNSTLVLFNSFEPSVHTLNTLPRSSSLQELSLDNRNRLKDIAVELSNECSINVEYLTRTTNLIAELDYQVKRLKADMVVMGMKSTETELRPGNTTTHFIHHAQYPILAVPGEAAFNGISKILFAFNPSGNNEENKLQVLMDLAGIFNAQIQVCHIEKIIQPVIKDSDYSTTVSAGLEKALNETNHSYKEIAANDVFKGIEEAIENWQPDLLVMVPHKYGLWGSFWHKSTTINMAKRTHIPLLTLPNTVTNIS